MEDFEISLANMMFFLCSQLPRSNKLCPSCGETEAVFFQSQQRSAETGMVSFPCSSPDQIDARKIRLMLLYLRPETLLRLLRMC